MKIKRFSAFFTALVLILALLPVMAMPVAAQATDTPQEPVVVAENGTVSVTFYGLPAGMPPRGNFYYTITMPHDGVLNITATRTGGRLGAMFIRFVPTDVMYNLIFNLRLNITETSQLSLRAGTYNLIIDYSHPDFAEVTFEYFISYARTLDWDGTPDPEPNDTPETATFLSPDTMVTGTVGTTNRVVHNHPTHIRDIDVYRIVLLEASEIEITLRGICAAAQVSVTNINDLRAAHGIPMWVGVHGQPMERSGRWSLPAGEHALLIEARTGRVWDSTAYELSFTVISGSAQTAAPTPDPTPDPTPPVTRPPSTYGVSIDGVEQNFEIPPQEIGGRMMLPFRAIGEALGMTVSHSAGTVFLSAPDISVSHVVGTEQITVNGVTQTFPGMASVATGGRTLMSVRMIATAVGADVRWDRPTLTAVIITN